MNSCIDGCRMNVNFPNFFSVECCPLSSSFALHHIWVESSTKDCRDHLQIMAVLVVSLHTYHRVNPSNLSSLDRHMIQLFQWLN